MTVVVTRNVASRFRGFLASCMLEIAPGVYTAPKMNAAVRDRVWAVCEEWYAELQEGSLVMTWRDAQKSGGQGVLLLGEPPTEMYDSEGVLLARRPLPPQKRQKTEKKFCDN